MLHSGQMLARFWACVALLAATASGAWERTVQSGKGEFIDSPPPHPLAYFQMDPCARPETDPVAAFFSCLSGKPSPEEAERRSQTTTELVEIGKIEDFTIYDLWYTRGFWGPSDNGRDGRSVIVKTGEDEYRELVATEWQPLAGALPTEIFAPGHGGFSGRRVPRWGERRHIIQNSLLLRHGWSTEARHERRG